MTLAISVALFVIKVSILLLVFRFATIDRNYYYRSHRDYHHDRKILPRSTFSFFVECLSSSSGSTSSSPICNLDGCSCITNIQKSVTINCTLLADRQQELKIDANYMPDNLLELIVNADSRRTELIFEAGSFSKMKYLQRVTVNNATSILLRRHAFLNLSSSHFIIEILNCQQVQVDSQAFLLTRGPVSITIANSDNVLIESLAFSWILNLKLIQIKDLRLNENVFSLESQRVTRHGPSTKVSLENVSIVELPQNTFPSSLLEIRLTGCTVGTVRKNVFAALNVYLVLIHNSAFNVIQSGAFSDRSLIEKLEFGNVQVGHIESAAVLSAASYLAILNSTMKIIQSGAFNMSTVISVNCVNNVFDEINDHGFTFKNWNIVVIENNTFRQLGYKAINVIPNDENEDNQTIKENRFSFIGNVIAELDDHPILSLNIGGRDRQSPFVINTVAIISKNIFIKSCYCGMQQWLETVLMVSQEFLQMFYQNSYCAVNLVLARCFKQSENAGFATLSNFTESVCQTEPFENAKIICNQHSILSNQSPNVEKALSILKEKRSLISNEKFLINCLITAVVTGICVVLVIRTFLWLQERSYIEKFRSFLFSLPSTGQRLLNCLSSTIRNDQEPISTNSINRISVHAYTELQLQSSTEVNGVVADSEDDEIMIVIYEDKATQTLPVELTQELLKSLKEKLDDPNPENYGEARHMIEHLYDLIKVEENCNNNTLSDEDAADSALEDQDEMTGNVYQVIGCPTSVTRRTVPRKKCSQSSMTDISVQVPVPLLELSSTLSSSSDTNCSSIAHRPTLKISDQYTEPLDQVIYEYSEIPTSSSPLPYNETSFELFLNNSSSSNKDNNRPLTISPITNSSALFVGRPLPEIQKCIDSDDDDDDL